MTFLATSLRDDGLNDANGRASMELHICSSEPTDRAGTLTASLGQKTSPTVGVAEAGTAGEGRKFVISAITDGTVDTTGTATHWALIDGTELMAAQSLTAGVGVTAAQSFSLDAINVEIPDV